MNGKQNMASPLMRGAISCAVACGAFLTGPWCVGAAVANADLVGLGGSGSSGGVDVLGVDVLGGGTARSGSGATSRVNAVSTAPSARTVVIHTKSSAAQPELSVVPATATAPMTARPAVAMGAPVVEAAVPAAPPPAAPMPAAGPISVPPPVGPVVYPPAPEAIPISPTSQPRPGRGIGPADTFSPPQRIPDSFRAGYAEYLRAADTGDLVAEALPGVVGIAGFTLAGAYAGYRQAKAVQQALLAPVPTSILL